MIGMDSGVILFLTDMKVSVTTVNVKIKTLIKWGDDPIPSDTSYVGDKGSGRDSGPHCGD